MVFLYSQAKRFRTSIYPSEYILTQKNTDSNLDAIPLSSSPIDSRAQLAVRITTWHVQDTNTWMKSHYWPYRFCWGEKFIYQERILQPTSQAPGLDSTSHCSDGHSFTISNTPALLRKPCVDNSRHHLGPTVLNTEARQFSPHSDSVMARKLLSARQQL